MSSEMSLEAIAVEEWAKSRGVDPEEAKRKYLPIIKAIEKEDRESVTKLKETVDALKSMDETTAKIASKLIRTPHEKVEQTVKILDRLHKRKGPEAKKPTEEEEETEKEAPPAQPPVQPAAPEGEEEETVPPEPEVEVERERSLEELEERVTELEHGKETLEGELAGVRETLEEQGTKIDEVKQTVAETPKLVADQVRETVEKTSRGAVYIGRVKKEVKKPDGTVEFEYDLHPSDVGTVKQASAMYDKVLPEMTREVRTMRQEVSSLGTRALTILERLLVPRLSKGGYYSPVTKRTVEEREKELESYEKRIPIEVKEEKPKKEEPKPKAEEAKATEEKKE